VVNYLSSIAARKIGRFAVIGRAISYLLNHWTKLALFPRPAGAPIDNNILGRALKRAILNRKNALFYKTLNGAGAGDLFMSLIHTCFPSDLIVGGLGPEQDP
jgi:transposase